jgi:biotin carboxyl carrier protein
VKTIEIEVNGAVRAVQIAKNGTRLIVVLDGTQHIVDAAEVEPGRWSLLVDERHASHEVWLRPGHPGEWIVSVDGATLPARLLDPRRPGRSTGAASHAGPARVVAPMPGKIVKVLVTPGMPVAARQGLIVVEAMKMENELRAPRAGTVREVIALEGASVDAGALLVTLE